MTSEIKPEIVREAFEKWYGSSPERNVKCPARYLNVRTQARWEAWQAATEQQATELSQLRAEREGLQKYVANEIDFLTKNKITQFGDGMLTVLQYIKSHLTRTEPKEGA